MACNGYTTGSLHTVNRKRLFQDVMNLYEDGSFSKEYPIDIEFVGEKGIDLGGVSREMFTMFWEEAYARFFDGSKTLIPVVCSQVDNATCSLLGKILSHGYLTTGILPDRIALPSLILILIGHTVEVPSDIILDSFIDYISDADRMLLKSALASKEFSSEVFGGVLSIVSKYGCRTIPNPSNLKKLILDIAYCEFCVKPAAALNNMHLGVSAYTSYWSNKSPQEVSVLFNLITITPSKVLNKLTSFCSNQAEQRIFEYLKTAIGNMGYTKLRLLLRFVTGASVCLSDDIDVTYNNLEGFERRPIAHTCSSTLELPTSYSNYGDFYNDIECVLNTAQDEFAWRMDSI